MPTRRHAGGWPLGLLGMLAVVVCVERAVDRRAARFVTVGATDWADTGASVRRAAGSEILVLGDSQLKHGVVPAVLEHRLGRKSYNLAVSGSTAPAHLFMFQRALRAGIRPAAVLVNGAFLDADPRTTLRAWPELLSPAECVDLAWSMGDLDAFTTLAVSLILPTVRTRPDARAAVLDALAGNPPSAAAMLPAFRRNWAVNRGATLLPPSEGPAKEVIPVARDPVSKWACLGVNSRYVERLLALAEARKIPVFWLVPPLHPGHQENHDRLGHAARYTAFLREIRTRHPGLTVIDGRHAAYPARVMADEVHLTRPGAAVFSDAVAMILADHLAGRRAPGWVEIPRWRDGADRAVESAVVLEDLRQTGEAFERYAARAEPGRVRR
ncbi:MAG: hypothetical protein U0835_22320 [Isosphaeraceae bacterium]